MQKNAFKRKDDQYERKNVPKMPDIMEAIFDTCYLLFDLVAGFIFLAKANGNMLFTLYGILTLTLCGGDAFHLVPRIKRAFKGSNEKIRDSLVLVYRYLLLL